MRQAKNKQQQIENKFIDLFSVPDADSCLGQLFDASTIECTTCHMQDVCATIVNNNKLKNKKADLSNNKPFLDEVRPIYDTASFDSYLAGAGYDGRVVNKQKLISAVKFLNDKATDTLIGLYVDLELNAHGFIAVGDNYIKNTL